MKGFEKLWGEALSWELASMVVTFDVDDTMWPMAKRAAQWLGLPYEILDNFWIEQNEHLSRAQQIQYREVLADPWLFQDMNFYPGVEKILELRRWGVQVKVCSNSSSAEIAEQKRRQLLEYVPGLKPEDLVLRVVDLGGTRQKRLPEFTIITAEDNPFALQQSTAKLNLMMKAPWNQTVAAQRMLQGVPLVPFGEGCFEDLLCYADAQLELLTKALARSQQWLSENR